MVKLMLLSDIENEETSVCIIPTFETIRNGKSLACLDSHNWKLERKEKFGEDGILFRARCNNCGLQRISIIDNLKESAGKAKGIARR
jgi:hypothetical protein